MSALPSGDFSNFPNPSGLRFEKVHCYGCNADDASYFITAQDDLAGKPGYFRFVSCNRCKLVYQNPRVVLDDIVQFYDEQYVAHRRNSNWGALTPLYEWAMGKHDRDKHRIVTKHVALHSGTELLDVGCAAGTFLMHMHETTGTRVSGVDFKDIADFPGREVIDFHLGLFYDQQLASNRFDAVTMWHFLEHCYDPQQSLREAHRVLKPSGRFIVEVPRLDSATWKAFGERWPGLQAPQHTLVFDKAHLISMVTEAGFEVEEYLPYGAFPAYFYIFTGIAAKFTHGKGIDFRRLIPLYFAGQLALTPLLVFEKKLNL